MWGWSYPARSHVPEPTQSLQILQIHLLLFLRARQSPRVPAWTDSPIHVDMGGDEDAEPCVRGDDRSSAGLKSSEYSADVLGCREEVVNGFVVGRIVMVDE